MILLIRQVLALYPDAKIVFKLHYDSINSKKSPDTSLNRVSFKFHYDSINSIWHSQLQIPLAKFKFHYDSINSPSLFFVLNGSVNT